MRRRVGIFAGIVAAALAVGAGGAWWWLRVPVPERPNVLLITLDTTRADHLSCYGYFRETTPNLDRLATRALKFEDAWAPMATTLPSHTSLMTGAWPLEHGVLANVEHGGRRTLASDVWVPVAELFRKEGYRTAAFTSAAPVKAGTGIERGFAEFHGPDFNVRRGRQTTEQAVDWLREHGRDPFFVWVHYYDPHGPFTGRAGHTRAFPPDEALRAWLAARAIPAEATRAGGRTIDPLEAHQGYDGELHYVDEQVGRLLDLLERKRFGERTIVVVVGDHGEGLGQHGVGGHGHVWTEQLRVPLLVYVPWISGRVVHEPIAMVDVMPTVLGFVPLAGRDGWLEAVSGVDVFREPSGPSLGLSSLRQAALGTPAQLSLTMGPWRYVEQGGEGALYHLGRDPHELEDLGPALPFHLAAIASEARRLHDHQHQRGTALGTGGTASIPEADLEALRELGYVDDEEGGDAAGAPDAESSGP